MARARFAVGAAIAALLLMRPLGATEGGPNGPAALLAKHRAFVGWQLGDGTLRTLRLRRVGADSDGTLQERTTEYRVGVVYRDHSMFPGQARVEDSGFTGSVFWASNDNGFTTPIYGDLAKYRLSYAVLMNEGTSALKGTPLGPVTVDGRVLQRVRIGVPHADSIDVDVDPVTGAYVRAVIDPDGDDETTIRILSYADALPGKKIVKSFRIGDSAPTTYVYTRIEPNVEISDANLHPPAARATWAFAADAPSFPIDVTPTRVLVDASVNGVKGRFILDTGANSIFLNEGFANRAKAQRLGAGGAAVGLYGALRSDRRRLDSLVLGGNTLSNVRVVAEDFNTRDYRGLDRQNYDGLLGYDVFAAARVKIDFQARRMSIADPIASADDPSGLQILTDTSLWVPMIPMTLNRTIAVHAMLDTGNPSTVVFGPDLLYKYHLRMARNIGVRAGMGSVECGNLDSLSIGPITYGGEAACKLDSALLPGRRILVGLDFLKHFTVVFDYPHGRLFLQLPHG